MKNKSNTLELDTDIFVCLMKFMEIKEIFRQLMVLNREIRESILSENYIMYKKYIKYFSLNPRLKRDDIIAFHDVFQMCK